MISVCRFPKPLCKSVLYYPDFIRKYAKSNQAPSVSHQRLFDLARAILNCDCPEEAAEDRLVFGGRFRPKSMELLAVISSAWLCIIENIPRSRLESFIELFQDHLLYVLPRPELFLNFLRDLSAKGGSCGLRALESIYIIMKHHNVEFSDFYEHLYNLTTAQSMNEEGTPEIIGTLSKFLQSNMIPMSILESFIEKLSVCSLSCHPTLSIWTYAFIHQALLENPTCRALIHCENQSDSITSLFSIQAIENHYWNRSKMSAKALREPFKRSKFDLSGLSTDIDGLFYVQGARAELQIKQTEIPYGVNDFEPSPF